MPASTARTPLVVSSLAVLLFFAPVPPPRTLQVYVGVSLKEQNGGVRVETVFNQSPAYLGGLQAGDVLTAIDGQEVKSEKDFVKALKPKKPDDVVRFTVMRSQREMLMLRGFDTGEGVMQPNQSMTVAFKVTPKRLFPYLGTLSTGNKISSVVPGGPAEKGGIQANDEIVAIDGNRILTPEEYNKRLFDCKPGAKVTMTVKRGEREQELKVTLGLRPGY